jgi:hypothetical protein
MGVLSERGCTPLLTWRSARAKPCPPSSTTMPSKVAAFTVSITSTSTTTWQQVQSGAWYNDPAPGQDCDEKPCCVTCTSGILCTEPCSSQRRQTLQRPCCASPVHHLIEVERLQHGQLAALHVQAQEVDVPHPEVRQHVPADAHAAAASEWAAAPPAPSSLILVSAAALTAVLLMSEQVLWCSAPEGEALHCRVPVRADVPAVPKLVAHEFDDPTHCTW